MEEASNQADLGGRAAASGGGDEAEEEEPESLELVLFHVNECYVYLIPPRKSVGSYRADEWNVNKWAWEGILKVVSKGEECIIKLEDSSTGELYARGFLRKEEPHPVEPVVDSSRYFVLRVEENIGGRLRHAFIGLGFRERDQAYDFQAALHDHMKYLNKKRTAEEMEQHYQSTSTVDYRLKEGETLVLQLKNNKGGGRVRSAFFEQGLNDLSLDDKASAKDGTPGLKPPPPPPAPLSPVSPVQKLNSVSPTPDPVQNPTSGPISHSTTVPFKATTPDVERSVQDTADDDFGDFQAAG